MHEDGIVADETIAGKGGQVSEDVKHGAGGGGYGGGGNKWRSLVIPGEAGAGVRWYC